MRAAIIEAVYNALNVAAVTNLAPVFHHVVDDTQPPFVRIADVSLSDEGDKEGGLFRASISIEAYYRGTKGSVAAALADAVAAALRNSTLSSAGMVPVRAHQVQTAGPSQGEDGVTYLATIVAEALVQLSLIHI